MSEQKKKKVNVRDLKPTKDAKGGYLGGNQTEVLITSPVRNFSFLSKKDFRSRK
jgi:hypothetical protein